MAIEEEVADHERQQQRNSRGSGSGTSGANNTTATDIEAIETIHADGEWYLSLSSQVFTVSYGKSLHWVLHTRLTIHKLLL